MTNELVPCLEKIYEQTGNPPVVAYETNNGGIFEIDRLNALNRKQAYTIYLQKHFGDINTQDQPEHKMGWTTNVATRPKMLGDLKEAVDNHVLTIYDKATIGEMYSFIVAQTNSSWKAQAEKHAHDDLIFAAAIAWQLKQTETIRKYPSVYKPYDRTKWQHD